MLEFIKYIIYIIAVILIVTGAIWYVSNINLSPVQIVGSGSSSGSTSPISKPEISIKNYSFQPSEVTVKAGDTVIWTNNDPVGHSVVADDNSFSGPMLRSGETFPLKFTKPGTYYYHCVPHTQMKGIVIVK